MTQKKPVVFLTRKLPDSTETRMRELFDARLNESDTPLSADELRTIREQYPSERPRWTDQPCVVHWEEAMEMLEAAAILEREQVLQQCRP